MASVPAGTDPAPTEPVWPSSGEEASFLAATPMRTIAVTSAPARERVPAPGGSVKLPPLEELVERIPPELREVLDDLFRARFTAVRKIAPRELKK